MNKLELEIIELKKRWNERASSWDNDLKDSKHYSNFEHSYERTDLFTIKFLKRFFSNIKALNALDLGCGTGESTTKLLPFAQNVFGVDISEKMIENADSKKYPVQFSCQNAMSLNFNNEMFDLVISRGIMISHVPIGGQEDIVKEVSRITHSGSVIIFDFLHDIETKKKYTKYSSPKAHYYQESVLKLLESVNIRGKYYYGGTKTERVNRIAIIKQ
ncbi:MAG TPA: class I SAM-dependent methyltransferase [Candidatus Dojkabacteria bacterium]